jgi:hypothetical protein
MYYLASGIRVPVVVPVRESLTWTWTWYSEPRKARPGVVRQEGVIGILPHVTLVGACASLTRASEDHQSHCGRRGPDQTLFCTGYSTTNPSSTLDSCRGHVRFTFLKRDPLSILYSRIITLLVFSLHFQQRGTRPQLLQLFRERVRSSLLQIKVALYIFLNPSNSTSLLNSFIISLGLAI